MLAGLLLAALSVGPSLGATEQALARQAGPQAQWTAFRGAMASEAWLLDPDLQPAPLVLGRRPDPAQARTWPGRSITSCDGSLAVSTGAARLADGTAARYVTIWERQPDRAWRWVLDGILDGEPPAPGASGHAATAACGIPPAAAADPAPEAGGAAGDGTLRWELVRDADRDRHRLVVKHAGAKGWVTFEDMPVR